MIRNRLTAYTASQQGSSGPLLAHLDDDESLVLIGRQHRGVAEPRAGDAMQQVHTLTLHEEGCITKMQSTTAGDGHQNAVPSRWAETCFVTEEFEDIITDHVHVVQDQVFLS